MRGLLIKGDKYIMYIFNTNLWYFSLFLKSSSLLYPVALMDISVVDFANNKNFRFELVYSFWSSNLKKRIFLKFFVNNNFSLISIIKFLVQQVD